MKTEFEKVNKDLLAALDKESAALKVATEMWRAYRTAQMAYSDAVRAVKDAEKKMRALGRRETK